MSICLITKGRMGGPESTMTAGVICNRGLLLFQIYQGIKAKFVFVRERALRVFEKERVE